ncbi:MAG: WG repeat-containing protein [Bergeyella zoohelcum]|nr:WG repeat-containing protein [Bergeyella zoohelcum]
MKKCLFLLLGMSMVLANAQTKKHTKLVQINKDIPLLIPQKKNGKFGYINQKGEVVIPHTYSNVGFFAEDCNLLHSNNPKVKKFGTAKYSSVRLEGIDYRIDMAGKRVYKFNDTDLVKCPSEYKAQKYHSFIRQGYYGVINKDTFQNEEDYRNYIIYPQYEYLHIMEGNNVENPMIIAVVNNRFGVIDINNKTIIPFEYSDIKRNFSWKLGNLFEVTKDGENYYFVDINNKGY